MGKYKVDICGVNTNELPVLSNDRMKELFKGLASGDLSCKEELILGNLKLVLSMVQRFSHRVDNMDDLFQIGCVGLIKAIDHFDLKHEVRFSTYAVPMILGEMKRHLRDNQMIRVSRQLKDLAYQAMRVKEEMMQKLDRDVSNEEIAKEMGEDARTVSRALDAILEPISLYDPIYSENGDSLYVLDQIRDENSNDEAWLDNIAIKNALYTLGDREKKILLMRFYNGKTQTEISKEIGISQAQVSRLEKSALEKMKKQMS